MRSQAVGRLALGQWSCASAVEEVDSHAMVFADVRGLQSAAEVRHQVDFCAVEGGIFGQDTWNRVVVRLGVVADDRRVDQQSE